MLFNHSPSTPAALMSIAHFLIPFRMKTKYCAGGCLLDRCRGSARAESLSGEFIDPCAVFSPKPKTQLLMHIARQVIIIVGEGGLLSNDLCQNLH